MELSTKFDAKTIEIQVKEYIKSINLEKQIFASDKPDKPFSSHELNHLPIVSRLTKNILQSVSISNPVLLNSKA